MVINIGNYCISLVSDGNSTNGKWMRLQRENYRHFSDPDVTIYSRIVPLDRYRSAWITHACSWTFVKWEWEKFYRIGPRRDKVRNEVFQSYSISFYCHFCYELKLHQQKIYKTSNWNYVIVQPTNITDLNTTNGIAQVVTM